MEYKALAKYYDEFYNKKEYTKEVEFLKQFIGNNQTVLDVGCGTGIHMSLLEQAGYEVEGIDLNEEMLEMAKKRVRGSLYIGNMLDFKLNKKYDAIICMFAVINHLTSYDELEKTLINFVNHLKENGIIILDLHNPQKSGSKTDSINGETRIMSWTIDEEQEFEHTSIDYIIDGKSYQTVHQFKIFKIDLINELVNKIGCTCEFYENYTILSASNTSKNIQVIIRK